MPRHAHELSDTEKAFIYAFVRGDTDRYLAVLLRHYGRETLAQVMRRTGLPTTTIHRLAVAFGATLDQYHAMLADADRAASYPNTENYAA